MSAVADHRTAERASRALAPLVALGAIVLMWVSGPSGVRAAVVVLFAAWVPGALMLSALDGRWRLTPSAPALGLSVSLLVVASELGLLFHRPFGRPEMTVLAGLSLLMLVFPRPLGRHR
jgi:uncharacterized membrane protein